MISVNKLAYIVGDGITCRNR